MRHETRKHKILEVFGGSVSVRKEIGMQNSKKWVSFHSWTISTPIVAPHSGRLHQPLSQLRKKENLA